MASPHPVLRAVRNQLVAGLIIIVPIFVTARALWWLFTYLDGMAHPLARAIAGRDLPGVGFALTVAVVFVTGLLFSSGPLRRLLEGLLEVIESLPIVGTVYGTLRKVLAGFGGPGSRRAFQKFVLVKRAGWLSPGFLTGTFELARKDEAAGALVAVFVPTNHLYLGEIVMLPARDLIDTDISVEDGISLVLSAGASVPARVREGEPPPTSA